MNGIDPSHSAAAPRSSLTVLRGGSMAAAIGPSLALLALLLAAWWGVTHAQWVSRVFVPTPEATWASLREGWVDGELAAQTAATAQRMLLGWGLASLLGVALGVTVGSSAAARAWVAPTLEFIRPLPASAVLPLAISIWGLSGQMVLAVVAFGALWPVLLSTAQGLAGVPERLREVGRALQMPQPNWVWKIGLPFALPDILAALRLSLTVALIVSVVGEMVASQTGLGQAILLAARAFRASELFAGIVLLSALGFASNALLAGLEHWLLRYQRQE